MITLSRCDHSVPLWSLYHVLIPSCCDHSTRCDHSILLWLRAVSLLPITNKDRGLEHSVTFSEQYNYYVCVVVVVFAPFFHMKNVAPYYCLYALSQFHWPVLLVWNTTVCQQERRFYFPCHRYCCCYVVTWFVHQGTDFQRAKKKKNALTEKKKKK